MLAMFPIAKGTTAGLHVIGRLTYDVITVVRHPLGSARRCGDLAHFVDAKAEATE